VAWGKVGERARDVSITSHRAFFSSCPLYPNDFARASLKKKNAPAHVGPDTAGPATVVHGVDADVSRVGHGDWRTRKVVGRDQNLPTTLTVSCKNFKGASDWLPLHPSRDRACLQPVSTCCQPYILLLSCAVESMDSHNALRHRAHRCVCVRACVG